MLYKPLFCCQCGEKVERTDWKLWTSRRFCELCETEHTLQEWTLKAFVGICVVLSVGFLGSAIFSPSKSNAVIASDSKKLEKADVSHDEKKLAPVSLVGKNNEIPLPSLSGKQGENEASRVKSESHSNKSVGNSDQQISVVSTSYFCGAETKKGTPCSRRVKSRGRCWQHAGQNAILPESQLVIIK